MDRDRNGARNHSRHRISTDRTGEIINFLQEIEALASKLAGDVTHLAMESFATLEKHIREHPEPVFALLREVKPILVTRGLAVVTHFEDVLEILDHPAEFNVPMLPR